MVAVIVAETLVPEGAFMPVTSPLLSTGATVVFELCQVAAGAPEMALPRASFGLAENCWVLPLLMLALLGRTATEAIACATVKAVPLLSAPPDFAKTLAVPLPAAVTLPDARTVTTAALSLRQLNVAPGIGLPLVSNAVAVSWTL